MSTAESFPRSTPESQGISSTAILAFADEAEKNLDALHSLMLLRHGSVVAEGWWSPYGAEIPHDLFSLSKSFTSTAVGMAVAEGRLSLDDPVLGFFPDEAPAVPSANLAAMKVRHLLSMSTGHAEDTMGPMFDAEDGDFARAFLALPVAHAPGTHFLYNTGATYMLSAILQRLTGITLLEYLQPRLFGPLGILGATWRSCPKGVNFGGFGLSVKTEDIARLGQLYLQRGVWQGKRLLPEEWVAQATAVQIANGSKPESDWEQGYGFQFWRCRYGAFRGDGAFGQFCLVLPEQDAVLAVTAGVGNMQAVLDLVWARLLPALQPGVLPEAPAAQAELVARLGHLSLSPQAGEATSPISPQVSGKRYLFPDNDQQVTALAFDFAARPAVVTLWDGNGPHPIPVGFGSWAKGTSSFGSEREEPVAASGAWVGEDTFVLKACYYESPFCPTIQCRFTGGQVLYDRTDNVSFGSTTHPQLVGQAE